MERAEQVMEPDDPRAGAPAPGLDPDAAVEQQERPLTLAGVSEDRSRLLLVDDRGATYTLPVTSSLRAALRGDATRLGQLEITMESTLRPRDIQARIRAGETAEAVAQAAQTSVDKIMAFVGPVLAERQHVAERAQRSNLRRSAGEAGASGTSRTLGESVEAHLRSLNVDPDGVEWDSWRREDGRWTLAAGYALPVRTGTAHFSYDVPGNYVVVDDADARWLVGEVTASSSSAAPAGRDDLRSVRERRLTPVRQDELPLGDDAIELVSGADATPVETGETYVDETAAAETAVAESAGAESAAPEAADTEPGVEAFLDDSPASDDPELREEATDAAAAEPEPAAEPDEPPARRTVQKKKGRASVPSWDEIMFGGPGSE